MVYVVEVKPGLFYAYRSVRLSGHKYPVKQYIGPASQTMINIKCSPTPDKSSSQERLDYKRSVLRLFDPELANNGQTWHIDYIITELPELDETTIREIVAHLMEGGLLMEAGADQYRRVV